VDVATVAGFATGRLGVDPVGGLPVVDWLVLTGQSVLEVIAGPMFTDGTAELAPVRAAVLRLHEITADRPPMRPPPCPNHHK
jgi:hypothetical protein